MKKIRVSKKAVRLYFAKLDEIENNFYSDVAEIEKEMQEEFGNKDIEFVWSENYICGVGTPNNPKKMKFLHRSDYDRTGKTV